MYQYIILLQQSETFHYLFNLKIIIQLKNHYLFTNLT